MNETNFFNKPQVSLIASLMLKLAEYIQSNHAFKGGYVLSKIVEKSRMTKDIDFDIEIKEWK